MDHNELQIKWIHEKYTVDCKGHETHPIWRHILQERFDYSIGLNMHIKIPSNVSQIQKHIKRTIRVHFWIILHPRSAKTNLFLDHIKKRSDS